MVRRVHSKRLRLCFRPSIHREEESRQDIPPMTSLHLLVADVRHAELCVLGGKFVVRPSQVRAYPETAGGLRATFTFFEYESFPLLLSPR